ncbi:homocysteine S-methyltransferase [Quadrisphaera granulorum]|nr:homocysteine S-methyltransferase [Quadrisphaera granulorum]
MDDVSHPSSSLRAALAAGSVLLDGGLSTELETRGHDVSTALWSARLLLDDPAAVVAAHAAFAAAGAQVVTTASYQATLPGLMAAGLERREAERVISSSVALARQGLDAGQEHGVDSAGRRGWVAGSIGAYGAHLADGSEYTGSYLHGPERVSQRQLREHHRPHLDLLAAAGADVVACETLPGAAEVEALVLELEALAVPAWVSMSAVVDDDGVARTRCGEPLAPVLAAAARVPTVIAVGVNCLDPSAVLPALQQVGAAVPAGEAALVVYPNSGEAWDAAARAWTGAGSAGERAGVGDDLSRGATQWLDAGARLVGGCCRVRPAHIAALAGVLTP